MDEDFHYNLTPEKLQNLNTQILRNTTLLLYVKLLYIYIYIYIKYSNSL